MAELRNVYDLFHPSPAPLQEIAAIQVALGLWRQEIEKQRKKNTLDDFDWPSDLPLSTLTSNVPSGIRPILEKYVKKVGKSIKDFLGGHISNGTFEFAILNCFDDFVCDLNGDIHGERTAERMILCDGISHKVKFKLACWYCFEEDISKFWPLVSSDVNLGNIDIESQPSLFYWISYLENKLDQISMNFDDYEVNYEVSSVEERVFNEFFAWGGGSWAAIRYFWNRLDSDAKKRCLTQSRGMLHSTIFCRYILTKLDENLLQELLRDHFTTFTTAILYIGITCYFSIEIFTYIKDKLDKEQFVSLARYLLKEFVSSTENALCLLEVWTSAPKNLKLAAISEILRDKPVFQISSFSEYNAMRNKNVYFLSAVLKDASVEDRKTFWKENRRDLYVGFGPKEFQRVIKIIGLKPKLVSEYEKIRLPFRVLLKDARFEELDEFLKFYCANEQIIGEIKLKGLSVDFTLNPYHVAVPFLLNRFIDDAHNNVNLANEFKTQLLESSQTIGELRKFIEIGRFQKVIKFVDILAPSEEIAEPIKNDDIIRAFILTLMDESNRRGCVDSMANFMRWCLGSDDAIEEFKEDFNVDHLMQFLIAAKKETVQDEMPYCTRYCNLKKKNIWDSLLSEFLRWYFVTKEDFEEFKDEYSGDFVFSETRLRINELYFMKLDEQEDKYQSVVVF